MQTYRHIYGTDPFVLNLLARYFNFTYQLIDYHRDYGSLSSNGSWSGTIGQLARNVWMINNDGFEKRLLKYDLNFQGTWFRYRWLCHYIWTYKCYKISTSTSIWSTYICNGQNNNFTGFWYIFQTIRINRMVMSANNINSIMFIIFGYQIFNAI